jgi:hypothetical protein
MKKTITFLFFIFLSTNAFCEKNKVSTFISCKKDVRKMRSEYVLGILREDHYLLKVTKYYDIQYWVNKNFLFRPWLSKKNINDKLTACEELRSVMNNQVNGPSGMPFGIRKVAEENDSSTTVDNSDLISAAGAI